MRARLVCSDKAFEITPITPDTQMLSLTEPTEWKWQIDSKIAGSQRIHLTVEAILPPYTEDNVRSVCSYDRFIEVNVTPQPPLIRYWPEESVTGLLAAGGGVLFLRKRVRDKRRKSSAILSVRADGAEIFLSYSRRDSDRVVSLVEKLRLAGFKVWIDQSGIDGATIWAKEITDAIQQTKVFILVASANSLASDHVNREASLAMSEKKPILPIYLEPVDMPPAIRYYLAGIQQINLYNGNTDEKLAQVIRSLEKLGIAPNKS
jgi:hypothetical protein